MRPPPASLLCSPTFQQAGKLESQHIEKSASWHHPPKARRGESRGESRSLVSRPNVPPCIHHPRSTCARPASHFLQLSRSLTPPVNQKTYRRTPARSPPPRPCPLQHPPAGAVSFQFIPPRLLYPVRPALAALLPTDAPQHPHHYPPTLQQTDFPTSQQAGKPESWQTWRHQRPGESRTPPRSAAKPPTTSTPCRARLHPAMTAQRKHCKLLSPAHPARPALVDPPPPRTLAASSFLTTTGGAIAAKTSPRSPPPAVSFQFITPPFSSLTPPVDCSAARHQHQRGSTPPPAEPDPLTRAGCLFSPYPRNPHHQPVPTAFLLHPADPAALAS